MIEQFKAHLIEELEKRKAEGEKSIIFSVSQDNINRIREGINQIDFCINLIKNTIPSQTSKKI